MALAQRTSSLEALSPNATGESSDVIHTGVAAAATRFVDYGILGFLLLFAIALPHSIKGAERSWKIALVLWLLKLAIDRLPPYKQPLAAPLLAYVTFSAISTCVSPDPYLSWDRMKFVCLFLV